MNRTALFVGVVMITLGCSGGGTGGSGGGSAAGGGSSTGGGSTGGGTSNGGGTATGGGGVGGGGGGGAGGGSATGGGGATPDAGPWTFLPMPDGGWGTRGCGTSTCGLRSFASSRRVAFPGRAQTEAPAASATTAPRRAAAASAAPAVSPMPFASPGNRTAASVLVFRATAMRRCRHRASPTYVACG